MSKISKILLSALLLAGVLCGCTSAKAPKNGAEGTAVVNSDGVFVDGKPFKFLAGEIHYFRVMPEYWRDRLEKMRACGMNTVTTYCPWNSHEPVSGTFDFSGRLDLRAFLKLCQDMDIKVMLRPGPYICSEWDFGGLPAWLLTEPNMEIRSRNPQFMKAVKSYYDRILDEAKPFFCNNGGPIIAIQIENGYASWGNDVKYLEDLRDIVLDTGFKGIIYTADGDSDVRINATGPKGVWRTLMIGEKLERGIEVMNETQPNMPQMISEWWVGQGLRLSNPMRIRNYPEMAKELDSVLAKGAHVACYMFHGGTNYGFMSGGLRNPPSLPYTPFVSSYDVDAMLNEAGDPTPKYFAFRDVFLKYNPDYKKFPVPPASEKKSYGTIKFEQVASFNDNIDNLAVKTIQSPNIKTMEELGQWYGFINYKSTLRPQSFKLPIELRGVRDRAWVNVDGEEKAVFTQNDKSTAVVVDVPKKGAELSILVENMGRVNFALTMAENRKGITGGVVLNKQQFQCNWTIQSLPLNNLEKIKWNALSSTSKPKYPAFFKGKFNVEKPADTYLCFKKGKRGYCWINGELLGRYDYTGPLLTTYVAAPLLKKGENTIEVLELEGMEDFCVDTVTSPVGIVKGEKMKLPYPVKK